MRTSSHWCAAVEHTRNGEPVTVQGRQGRHAIDGGVAKNLPERKMEAVFGDSLSISRRPPGGRMRSVQYSAQPLQIDRENFLLDGNSADHGSVDTRRIRPGRMETWLRLLKGHILIY